METLADWMVALGALAAVFAGGVGLAGVTGSWRYGEGLGPDVTKWFRWSRRRLLPIGMAGAVFALVGKLFGGAT